MNKKILPALFLFVICTAFFACKKSNNSTNGNSDAARQYFPIQPGKYVVYNVDSTIYNDSNCSVINHACQIRYAIADTFRDANDSLSYIMNVSYRPAADSSWQKTGVQFVTPTSRSIEVVSGGYRFIRMVFPVIEGEVWKGNSAIEGHDTANFYFSNWNYSYMNNGQQFNNGYVYFNNTLTVLEDDETRYSSEYAVESAINYRTYAKEIYAYNIGMVYSEWTHWEVKKPSASCKVGYSVIMRAVDHN